MITRISIMKFRLLALISLAAATLAQDPPDPTRASPRMKAALMAGGSAIPDMTIKGMVLSAAREGGTDQPPVAGFRSPLFRSPYFLR